jgi:hypothetical protein
LQSAALADRQRLDREQRRVDQRLTVLKHQLVELEAVQADLAERRKVLDLLAHGTDRQLAVPSAHAASHDAGRIPTRNASQAAAAQEHSAPGTKLLRGSRIRVAAVHVLARSSRAREAIHYREWHRLFIEAGFSIAGKDPEASFLTQLSRSPVVRRSTQAGIYELDFDFVARARAQLQRLRATLRAAHDAPDAVTAEELEAGRIKRIALQDEIGAVERQLQEALETLGDNLTASGR